jgi:MFS family permease
MRHIGTTQSCLQYRYQGTYVSLSGMLGMLISNSFMGRKMTMAPSAFLVAYTLYLFTVARDSTLQLVAASCAALFQNIMYAVLYAYIAEVYPTHVRGTQ